MNYEIEEKVRDQAREIELLKRIIKRLLDEYEQAEEQKRKIKEQREKEDKMRWEERLAKHRRKMKQEEEQKQKIQTVFPLQTVKLW